MASPPKTAIPILLLKTKSSPADAYEDLFSSSSTSLPTELENHGSRFSPQFVPVLQHRFEEPGMNKIKYLLLEKQVSTSKGSRFGGMIFTSQRAVEAFAKLVNEELTEEHTSPIHDIPIYSVGPATTRCLKAISPNLNIFGSHTGNGEALAHYIQEHYSTYYAERHSPSSLPLPALLFLVGEQRRDIIPKTLMSQDLPPEKRIEVTEEVVYGTGVMESFETDFSAILAETSALPERWVVVFSPTGCEAMLRSLGLLNGDSSKLKEPETDAKKRATLIATIGPTTQTYLRTTFSFEPDVSAETPSPEGVLDAIRAFRSKQA